MRTWNSEKDIWRRESPKRRETFFSCGTRGFIRRTVLCIFCSESGYSMLSVRSQRQRDYLANATPLRIVNTNYLNIFTFLYYPYERVSRSMHSSIVRRKRRLQLISLSVFLHVVGWHTSTGRRRMVRCLCMERNTVLIELSTDMWCDGGHDGGDMFFIHRSLSD